MEKFGLISLNLSCSRLALPPPPPPPKRIPRTNPSSTKQPSSLLPRRPLRRSSRLRNLTPPSYSEAALTKKDGLFEDGDIKQWVGSMPVMYMEEQEKLLGNTERSWTLYMDGCGKD